MGAFHHKGDRAELERAAENSRDMLGYVDHLGDMIMEARGKQPAAERVTESA